MKLGLALSGGGIRGIAHAGVLKALEDNNIKIDIIGGTSSGSMIATLYAMGYSPYYIYLLFKKYANSIAKTNTFPFLLGIDKIFRKTNITGMKSGEDIEILYDNLAKRRGFNNISEIDMPIVVPSVDLIQGKEYIFTNQIPNNTNPCIEYIDNISIGKMVRASSSFPAVFSPCNIQNCAFADGGALDNIPIEEVKRQGADKVIAVKFNSEKINNQSNMMDIAMKTIDIMGNKISESGLAKSDYVLNIYTDKVGLLDTNKLDKCFQYGYDCTIANIEHLNFNEIL